MTAMNLAGAACSCGGYLTLEYEHDPWMDCDRVDVMTETIRMRDVVRPLLASES